MSYTELAAVLTAVATLIGALGWGAYRNGKKEAPLTADKLATTEDIEKLSATLERAIRDGDGSVRQMHQEMRLDNRDARDRLVRLEERISALRQ